MSVPEPHTHFVVKDGTIHGNLVQAQNIVVDLGVLILERTGDRSLLDALSTEPGMAIDGVPVDRLRAKLVDGLANLIRNFPGELDAVVDTSGLSIRSKPAAGVPVWVLEVIRAAFRVVDQRLSEQKIAQLRHSEQIDGLMVALMELTNRLGESAVDYTPAADAGPAASAVCPYPGLAAFTTNQGNLFFGRGELTARLLRRMTEQQAHGRPLLVIGASGAGKSSLLRAGLVPALGRGEMSVPGSAAWPCGLIRPGTSPLTALVTLVANWAGILLSTALDDVRTEPERFTRLIRQAVLAQVGESELDAPSRIVLIVDQFEEAFLQCTDSAERLAFLGAIRAAARVVDDDVTTPAAFVVLGLRADAYTHCASTPLLADVVRHSQFLVGPMSADELRQAIERPADSAGLSLDDGLAQQMIEDLGTVDAIDGDYQPGGLPLLASALVATWEGRRGTSLTLAGYRNGGGVHGAVAVAAERVFDGLAEPEQRVLRRLLMSLVAIGDGVQDSRRRTPRQALVGDDTVAAKVLDRLIEARLVTITDPKQQVEIIHDALLVKWPRLKTWLLADRAAMLGRDQLIRHVQVWLDLDRDEGSLYRGAQLALVRVQVEEGRELDLSPAEREFIAASIAADDYQHDHERRQVRRFKRLVSGVAVLLVLALIAGSIAASQWRRADVNRAEAVSRQYAAESIAAAAASPRRAILLALRAYQAAPSAEARGALLSAAVSGHEGVLDVDGGRNVAVSPDGSLVAIVGTNNRAELWRTADHGRLAVDLSGDRTSVTGLSFSPDGRMLATASLGLTAASTGLEGVTVREMPSGRVVTRLRGISTVSWRPDGQRLVAVAPARDRGWVLRVWRTDTWQEIGEIPMPETEPSHVVYSPSGDHIAVGGGDGTTAVWDVNGRLIWRHQGDPGGLVSVAWSPDSVTLASGATSDAQVRFWNAATGNPVGETILDRDRPGAITSLVYTPDGRNVMIADGSRPLRVWGVRQRTWASETFGSGYTTNAVGLSSDGHTMVLVPEVGPATVWRREPRWLSWQNGPVLSVSFGPDSATLVAGSASGSMVTWDTATRTPQWTVERPTAVIFVALSSQGLTASGSGDTVLISGPAGAEMAAPRLAGMNIAGMTFAPDGELLLIAADQPQLGAARPGSLTTWSTKTWQRKSTAEFGVAAGLSAPVISPDGTRVIVVVTVPTRTDTLTLRSSVKVLKTDDLTEERVIDTGADQVLDAALSPDGHTVATVGRDRQVSLWDLDTGQRRARFGDHPGSVRSIAFAPDGSQVATGSADSVVRLWSATTGALQATLVGHTGELNKIAWAADGTLATAGSDGRVGVWDLDANRVFTQLCQAIAHPKVNDEWHALGVTPTDRPCR